MSGYGYWRAGVGAVFGFPCEAGCPVCSSIADNLRPNVVSLKARGVPLICASRASLGKLLAHRERMGRSFDWVSSGDSDFHRDLGFTYSEDELKSFRLGGASPTRPRFS